MSIRFDEPCLRCENERLRDALSHIQWVKDCGIDSFDKRTGMLINHADEERDAMYRIATETIGPSRDALETGRAQSAGGGKQS